MSSPNLADQLFHALRENLDVRFCNTNHYSIRVVTLDTKTGFRVESTINHHFQEKLVAESLAHCRAIHKDTRDKAKKVSDRILGLDRQDFQCPFCGQITKGRYFEETKCETCGEIFAFGSLPESST